MKIRTSENPHAFQESLFRRLNAYSLQGLLMNAQHQFTAAVEAIEYEPGDNERTKTFRIDELHAKYVLSRQIGVPFYVVTFKNGIFSIFRVFEKDGKISIKGERSLNEVQFAQWWGTIKGTIQNKLLNNGGENRIERTVFDRVLRQHGLEWGGNIDGFVLSNDNQSVKYIIDNISVSRSLDDNYANPAIYFNSTNPRHGPRYEGWYAAVKLANQLHVPHALFTIDKKNPRAEHIGFTIIERLTPQGIFYKNNLNPNDNVIEGMDHIVRTINGKIEKAESPILVERK